MSGPPDGGKLVEVEEKAEVVPIRQGKVWRWRECLPEGLAEDEGEAADRTHTHQRGGGGDDGKLGDDADGSGVEDAEGEGEDGFGGGELAGGGFKGDAASGPMDGVNAGVEAERAAGGAKAVGEEVWQTIVALTDVRDAVAIDGVFGGLLDAEGDGADLCCICGIEAFDVAGGSGAEVVAGGEAGLSEEVTEAEIGAGEGTELLDGIEHTGTALTPGGEMAVFEAELGAVALAQGEACFRDESEELGWSSVNELGAKLDNLIGDTLREDTAADAISRFHKADLKTTLSEDAGADKAGDAGTCDEDVERLEGMVGDGWCVTCHRELRCACGDFCGVVRDGERERRPGWERIRTHEQQTTSGRSGRQGHPGSGTPRGLSKLSRLRQRCASPSPGVRECGALRFRSGFAEALLDESETFLGGADRGFELGVFGGFEHGFELRAGFVTSLDQIATGDEERRAVPFRGFGLEARFHGLPDAELAVAGAAIEPVKLQMFVELGQAKEALDGGFFHLRDVAEAHVVLDEGEDLLGVFVREAEALEDDLGDADADFDVAVEADARRGTGAVQMIGGGLADVVQKRAPGEGGRADGLEFLEEEHGVDPDVAFGVPVGGLLDAVHGDGFGEDFGEQAEFVEKLKGSTRVTFGEHAGEFVAHALGADLINSGGKVCDGLRGFGVDVEAEAGGEADGPEHAELVFGEAGDGVADGADDAKLEIVAAVDEVANGAVEIVRGFEVERIEEHAVDGDVTAEDVFARIGGEANGVGPTAIGVGAIVTEGGHLNGVALVGDLA